MERFCGVEGEKQQRRQDESVMSDADDLLAIPEARDALLGEIDRSGSGGYCRVFQSAASRSQLAGDMSVLHLRGVRNLFSALGMLWGVRESSLRMQEF